VNIGIAGNRKQVRQRPRLYTSGAAPYLRDWLTRNVRLVISRCDAGAEGFRRLIDAALRQPGDELSRLVGRQCQASGGEKSSRVRASGPSVVASPFPQHGPSPRHGPLPKRADVAVAAVFATVAFAHRRPGQAGQLPRG
jgi:hypothetical protein